MSRCLRSMAFSGVVGLGCGLPALWISLTAAGAGHGDSLPMLLLFAPSWLLVRPAEAFLWRSDHDCLWIVAMSLQYGLYGALLGLRHHSHRAMDVLVGIVLCHYVAVLAMAVLLGEVGYEGVFPGLAFLAVLWFAAMHCAAVWHVAFRQPKRRQLTIGGVMVITLVFALWLSWIITFCGLQ